MFAAFPFCCRRFGPGPSRGLGWRRKPGRLLYGNVEDCVEPVKGGLEVEIVPETMTEDESVWAGGFLDGEEATETVEFVGRDGEADHLLNLNGDVNDGVKKALEGRNVAH